MYQHAIRQECLSRLGNKNENFDLKDKEFKEVVNKVNKFWALPTFNKSMPPPHSTGAAIDLTLAVKNGSALNMGGEIDCIGAKSEPNYFLQLAKVDNKSSASLWHSRRLLLNDIMTNVGFVRHPNEWWHFSYGDQLWAWLTKSDAGFYGTVEE